MKRLLPLAALSVTLASCTSGPSVPYNQQQTERLYGTWQFNYSVNGTPYSRVYRLNTLQQSTVTPGEYNLWGTDEYGDPVLGGYEADGKSFSLYDPSLDFDRFYSFDLNSATAVSGCYYQIYADDTDSGCIPFTGTRTSATVSAGQAGRETGELKKAPGITASSVAAHGGAYQKLKRQWH